MREFMAIIRLPDEFTEDFVRLIPRQRAAINLLMREGTIAAYSLSADRTMLWVTIRANNKREVREIIKSFPLYDYMKETIVELMFHEQASTLIPELSLN
jgi:muconolactone delta-isomerase